MGDLSQSRYSIVERLTSKKLNIMEKKSDLNDGIKGKEHEVDSNKDAYKNWKSELKFKNERTDRDFKTNIDYAETQLKNAKEKLKGKEKVYDEQIKAVEAALESIEQISKAQTFTESKK